MKKFLVLAAAASLSASSALAGAGDFYAKGTVGYAKFNNEKWESNKVIPSGLEKMKAKNGSATFAIGAGYYITDVIRADVMLEHFTNTQHESSGTKVISATQSASAAAQGIVVPAGSYNEVLKLKSRSTAAMINAYADFANVGDVKFFAGLGLGMVRTTGKASYSIKQPSSGTVLYDETTKVKTKNAMAYAVHLGATTQVVDDVNVDLTYSWRDLGSVKLKDSKSDNTSFPYRGHQVALGIRYDI